MGGQEDITKLSWIFSSSRLAQNIFQVLGAGHLDKLTGRETTIIMLFFRIRVLLTAISVFVLVQLTVAYPLPWVPDVSSSSSLNLDRANTTVSLRTTLLSRELKSLRMHLSNMTMSGYINENSRLRTESIRNRIRVEGIRRRTTLLLPSMSRTTNRLRTASTRGCVLSCILHNQTNP